MSRPTIEEFRRALSEFSFAQWQAGAAVGTIHELTHQTVAERERDKLIAIFTRALESAP